MTRLKEITAIIIEDEELPRLSLISKLNEYHPDIQIIAACEDYDTGLIEILTGKPDILFLDIHLQDRTGLSLQEQLLKIPELKMPQVIFTTAYCEKEYLLKAIKLSASDYLLKPVDIDELGKAVEKAKAAISPHDINETYSFKTFNSLLLLKPEDIMCCKADGNYSEMILTHGKNEVIFERLGEIEKKLDPAIFIRAGKSLIINKNYIYKLDIKNNRCRLRTSEGKLADISVPEKVMTELKRNHAS
jgi:two-component system LytT family response regulator